MIAEKIRKLLQDQKMTQNDLARFIGAHPSSIGNYLYGQRKPDPLTCILFAAVAKSQEDRRFFLDQSGLDDSQLALLSAATAGISAGRPDVSVEKQRRRAK